MALRIRLRRMGSTKRPFYRIVVAEANMPRDGRFVDIVGHYNPVTDPVDIRVEEEKVYRWLRQGARPTDTVRSLLRRVGVWRKWGLLKRGVDPSQLEQMVSGASAQEMNSVDMTMSQAEEPTAEAKPQPAVPGDEETTSETEG